MKMNKTAKISSVSFALMLIISTFSFAKTVAILRPRNADSGYVSGCSVKSQPCELQLTNKLRSFAK